MLMTSLILLATILFLVILVLTVPILRRNLITVWIVSAIAHFKLLPKISETERAAIEAGNAWVEQEFSANASRFLS